MLAKYPTTYAVLILGIVLLWVANPSTALGQARVAPPCCPTVCNPVAPPCSPTVCNPVAPPGNPNCLTRGTQLLPWANGYSFPYAPGYGFYTPYVPVAYPVYYPYPAAAPLATVNAVPANTAQPALGSSYPQPEPVPAPPKEIAARPDIAEFTLEVPENAEVWLEGVKMKQGGAQRKFLSPALKPGVRYAYEVRIAWVDKGRQVSVTHQLSLRAGDRSRLTVLGPAAPEKPAASVSVANR